MTNLATTLVQAGNSVLDPELLRGPGEEYFPAWLKKHRAHLVCNEIADVGKIDWPARRHKAPGRRKKTV